jgi:hypothetical protein
MNGNVAGIPLVPTENHLIKYTIRFSFAKTSGNQVQRESSYEKVNVSPSLSSTPGIQSCVMHLFDA